MSGLGWIFLVGLGWDEGRSRSAWAGMRGRVRPPELSDLHHDPLTVPLTPARLSEAAAQPCSGPLSEFY